MIRNQQVGGSIPPAGSSTTRGCEIILIALFAYVGTMQARDFKQVRPYTGLFYVRFMDDWIVLSPNRWKLKKAIQIVNQTLNELKVQKHPDKTFIGRVAKGFDFLGYSFEPKGLSIAPKTLANFLDRIIQL